MPHKVKNHLKKGKQYDPEEVFHLEKKLEKDKTVTANKIFENYKPPKKHTNLSEKGAKK